MAAVDVVLYYPKIDNWLPLTYILRHLKIHSWLDFIMEVFFIYLICRIWAFVRVLSGVRAEKENINLENISLEINNRSLFLYRTRYTFVTLYDFTKIILQQFFISTICIFNVEISINQLVVAASLKTLKMYEKK